MNVGLLTENLSLIQFSSKSSTVIITIFKQKIFSLHQADYLLHNILGSLLITCLFCPPFPSTGLRDIVLNATEASLHCHSVGLILTCQPLWGCQWRDDMGYDLHDLQPTGIGGLQHLQPLVWFTYWLTPIFYITLNKLLISCKFTLAKSGMTTWGSCLIFSHSTALMCRFNSITIDICTMKVDNCTYFFIVQININVNPQADLEDPERLKRQNPHHVMIFHCQNALFQFAWTPPDLL